MKEIVRSEVLRAVCMKMSVSLDTASCDEP
jgi:hypothetical protein